MKWILGVDEAGYGPNLGPLVVVASVWSVRDDCDVRDGLAAWRPEFQAGAWRPECDHIPLGDSKTIYRPGLTLDGLQAGVDFLVRSAEPQGSDPTRGLAGGPRGGMLYGPAALSRCLAAVAAEDHARVESVPWYASRWSDSRWPESRWPDSQRPKSATTPSVALRPEVAQKGFQKLKALGVEFMGYRARVIDEPEFNRCVAIAGNKATALSHWSIGLVLACLADAKLQPKEGQSIEVYCDRHGGRKHYAPLLTHGFGSHPSSADACWFDILSETSHCSRYASRWRDRPFTIQFQVEGDSLFPSAASSMLAKWIREAMMSRLNRFWEEQLGQPLKPTAGYAVDAARFAKAIAPALQRIGLASDQWWRQR
jgi:hypothetical protein